MAPTHGQSGRPLCISVRSRSCFGNGRCSVATPIKRTARPGETAGAEAPGRPHVQRAALGCTRAGPAHHDHAQLAAFDADVCVPASDRIAVHRQLPRGTPEQNRPEAAEPCSRTHEKRSLT